MGNPGRRRENGNKAPSKPLNEEDNSKERKRYADILKSHKTWSRLIFIAALLIYMLFSTKRKEISLAKQQDVLDQRGQTFECNDSYKDEIASLHPDCSPKKCGRHVFDMSLTDYEISTLLDLGKKGFELGVSDGGASIFDLHSGALSVGDKFINVYAIESKQPLVNRNDINVYKTVKAKIMGIISDTFHIPDHCLHLTHPTFFSRLTNLDPKTANDEYWHTHVDKETYESFHFTSLVYLTDYGTDFKGGRIIFVDGPKDKPHTNVTVEPRRGRILVFTSGAENMHYVERVTEGIRYAITVSFTCDEKKSITDPLPIQ